ncbi:selenocysteine lyase isoform X3 [Pelodiscus sinensis]|uniref:selenocysteine lyase isoform X3 n=1 Tax=Pelodiscus sinensis TaxID=13735 RepID=UPI003F6C5F18
MPMVTASVSVSPRERRQRASCYPAAWSALQPPPPRRAGSAAALARPWPPGNCRTRQPGPGLCPPAVPRASQPPTHPNGSPRPLREGSARPGEGRSQSTLPPPSWKRAPRAHALPGVVFQQPLYSLNRKCYSRSAPRDLDGVCLACLSARFYRRGGSASRSWATCPAPSVRSSVVCYARCGRGHRPRRRSAAASLRRRRDFCRMEGDQVEKMVLSNDGRKTAVDKECDGEQNKSVESKVYMDYNATTPVAPEVIQSVTETMCGAWGNPSSSYPAGRKAKEIIHEARENLAQMVGGRPQDIIFTSGGTEANNLVIHTALRHFREIQVLGQDRAGEDHKRTAGAIPHFVTSNVEHDSVRLPLEHLVKEHMAEATFVPVSKVSGQVEVDDIIAAIRTTTCLVSIMLANNETGIIMFYAPRIGALYVRGPGVTTPLHPMLFGGGQERNFRPGTENTPMIAGLGKAAELVNKNCEDYEARMREVRDYLEERLEASFGKQRLYLNSQFAGAKRLCNTCNFSVSGTGLQGRMVLSCCKTLLASVGAACHSENGDHFFRITQEEQVLSTGSRVTPSRRLKTYSRHDRSLSNLDECDIRGPSSILLSCGIPYEVAQNALRLSVGRDTTKEDVDVVVEDLKQAVAQLEHNSHIEIRRGN